MENRNSLTKELASIEIYLESVSSFTVKRRIRHILDWYIRKATFYKKLFYFLSVVVILINAAIPVINQIKFTYCDNVTSIISALASILTSFLTLFTMKDTWFRYRKAVELIKKECMLFTGRYSDYKKSNREEILIRNIEEIISNERDLWEHGKFNKYNEESEEKEID